MKIKRCKECGTPIHRYTDPNTASEGWCCDSCGWQLLDEDEFAKLSRWCFACRKEAMAELGLEYTQRIQSGIDVIKHAESKYSTSTVLAFQILSEDLLNDGQHDLIKALAAAMAEIYVRGEHTRKGDM